MKPRLHCLAIAILFCVVVNYFIPNPVLAQITITASGFQSQIGTKEVLTAYSSTDLHGLDLLIAISGANKIWDITDRAFTFQRSDTCSYFDSPMLTPAANDSVFVNCDFVSCKTSSGSADTVWDFFYLAETGFAMKGSLNGGNGSYDKVVFDPQYYIWKFPATIGSNWKNSTMVTLYPMGISQYVKDSVLIDGFGKIVTPRGTFDCLRLRRKSVTDLPSYEFSDGTKTYAIVTTDRDNIPTGLNYYASNIVNSTPNINDILVPTRFILSQNYPNPFNPNTTIRFELPRESFVTLKVFNVLGQEVATLENERREAGKHEARFDAGNLPSGVYFYRLNAGEYIQARKLLLLK